MKKTKKKRSSTIKTYTPVLQVLLFFMLISCNDVFTQTPFDGTIFYVFQCAMKTWFMPQPVHTGNESPANIQFLLAHLLPKLEVAHPFAFAVQHEFC